jgi:hypothetical protein
MIHVKELRWRRATHFTDHLFLVNQMQMQTPRQILLSFFYWLLDAFEDLCVIVHSAAADVVVTLVCSVKVVD